MSSVTPRAQPAVHASSRAAATLRGGGAAAAASRPAAPLVGEVLTARAWWSAREETDATLTPRLPCSADFLKQILRWAEGALTDPAGAKHGYPMRVEGQFDEFDNPTGFTLFIGRYGSDGEVIADIECDCSMDAETYQVYDTVDLDQQTGQMKPMRRDGKEITETGKAFEIRRKKTPTTDEMVTVLKLVLTDLMGAVNKYYAFGSCFSEDF